MEHRTVPQFYVMYYQNPCPIPSSVRLKRRLRTYNPFAACKSNYFIQTSTLTDESVKGGTCAHVYTTSTHHKRSPLAHTTRNVNDSKDTIGIVISILGSLLTYRLWNFIEGSVWVNFRRAPAGRSVACRTGERETAATQGCLGLGQSLRSIKTGTSLIGKLLYRNGPFYFPNCW